MLWLQYVPHAQIVAFLAKGWRISDELHGTNHGHYSVLMCIESDPTQTERIYHGQRPSEESTASHATAGRQDATADASERRQEEVT